MLFLSVSTTTSASLPSGSTNFTGFQAQYGTSSSGARRADLCVANNGEMLGYLSAMGSTLKNSPDRSLS